LVPRDDDPEHLFACFFPVDSEVALSIRNGEGTGVSLTPTEES
jgi:hypothetical protein